MKMWTWFFAGVVLAVGQVSLVRADDQSSGCGAGYYVVKRNSLLSSYTRQLTNITLSNTSAMTSGTSGCAKHSIVLNDKLPQHYVESTYPILVSELATGQGEYVQALAQSLGCSGVEARFGEVVRSHYEAIVPAQGGSANQMLRSVKQAIREDRVLSEQCAGPVS